MQNWVCRSWITRRIVWTIDYIFISKVGEDAVIDSIPLSEAANITCNEQLDSRHASDDKTVGKGFDKDRNSRKICPEVETEHKNKKSNLISHRSRTISGSKLDGKIDDSKLSRGKIVLQITTAPEGFNSGKFGLCLVCFIQFNNFFHFRDSELPKLSSLPQ